MDSFDGIGNSNIGCIISRDKQKIKMICDQLKVMSHFYYLYLMHFIIKARHFLYWKNDNQMHEFIKERKLRSEYRLIINHQLYFI